MEFLGKSFEYTSTFYVVYGHNIKIIFVILKNKWLQLWHGIFTRDKIMISIIHGKKTFSLYKTSTSGK